MVPVIDTPRLRLRGHQPADLQARAAILSDPEVYRFTGGTEQDRAEHWARILRYTGHWALLGWGMFAVEERATGGLIGEVGLCRFERGFGPDFDCAPEAAWLLARHAWGKGLASEAAGAAFRWHEHTFGAQRAVCLVAAANTASLRMATKLGFRPFREIAFRGQAAILHERLPKGAEAR